MVLKGEFFWPDIDPEVPVRGLTMRKIRLLQCPLAGRHLVAWMCVTSGPLEGS